MQNLSVEEIFLANKEGQKKSFLVYENGAGRVKWSSFGENDVVPQNTSGYIVTDSFAVPLIDNSSITNLGKNSVCIGSSLNINSGSNDPNSIVIGYDLTSENVKKNQIIIGTNSSITKSGGDDYEGDLILVGPLNNVDLNFTSTIFDNFKHIIFSTSNSFKMEDTASNVSKHTFISAKAYHQNITYNMLHFPSLYILNDNYVEGGPTTYFPKGICLGRSRATNADITIGRDDSDRATQTLVYSIMIGYNPYTDLTLTNYTNVIGVYNDAVQTVNRNITTGTYFPSILQPVNAITRGNSLMAMRSINTGIGGLTTIELSTINVNVLVRNVNYTFTNFTVDADHFVGPYSLTLLEESALARSFDGFYFFHFFQLLGSIIPNTNANDLTNLIVLTFDVNIINSTFNYCYGFGTLSDGTPIYVERIDSNSIRCTIRIEHRTTSDFKRIGVGITWSGYNNLYGSICFKTF